MKIFFKISLAAVFMMVAVQVMAVVKPVTVYAYGFSASFNDSVVYFTEVQQIDSAWVDTKTVALYGRGDYSAQLKTYMTELGVKTPTAIIVFDTTREGVEKKFAKMRAKYVQEPGTKKKKLLGNYIVKDIPNTEFRFETVSARGDTNANTAETKAAIKEAEKATRQAEKEQKKARREEIKAAKAAAKGI